MKRVIQLTWAVGIILMLAAVYLWAAPPSGIYVGGNYDGYDRNTITNSLIPQPPGKGTVIKIQ